MLAGTERANEREKMLHFAYLFLGFFALTLFTVGFFYKIKFYKPIYYKYSLTSYFKAKGIKTFSFPSRLFFILRFITLSILTFLSFKPQIANYKNPTKVDGIDIILTLDVSQSMLSFDDLKDQRPRFEVAKEEAVKFIDKRKNDSIGLVIFAKQAVTRCPLTLDKTMLKNIINDLKIGFIDGDGTAISRSLLTSANRLKNSDAKSKVIIFLTDGLPTVADADPQETIQILQKLGIRVYTIGIGSQEGGYFNHPLLGLISAHTTLNVPLLEKFAHETGGEFFLAKNPKDMQEIYTYIDQLETNKHETKIYYNYYDIFLPFLIFALILLSFELFLSTSVWFVV